MCLICFAATNVFARNRKDIIKQQQELDKIQQEVEDSRRKLDELKSLESSVQKKVSDFDQRISSNKKVVARLNNEMKQIKQNIKETEAKLNSSKVEYELSVKRFLGNIRQFYVTTTAKSNAININPNTEVERDRKITLLAAVANFEVGSLNEASEFLEQTAESRNKLLGEQKQVTKLRKTKETSTALEKSKKEKEEKELEKLRRKKTQEADRLMTLEQAAREMEMILVRLEQERSNRNKRSESSGPSFFVNMKGRMQSPYRGKIVVPFGESVDRVTNLKSFSPGITIKGTPGGTVFSVAAGSVAYVGDLRGYGNFVIIDHDGLYFTTYAGLEKASVIVGELIASGMKLGVAKKEGTVKFELRKGREPLDPVQWISIDAF